MSLEHAQAALAELAAERRAAIRPVKALVCARWRGRIEWIKIGDPGDARNVPGP